MINWTLSLFQSGVHGRGTSVLGGFLSGGLSFISGEAITGNSWVAVLLAALSAPFGAFLATGWAKVIDARRQARVSDAETSANLFKRAQETHKHEIAQMRHSSAVQSRKEVLLRNSKHKVLGVVQSYEWHIVELNHILRDMNVEIPPFERVSITDLLQEEDAKLDELTQTSMKDTERIRIDNLQD